MNKVSKFEDLIAWQKAQDLSVEVYGLFKTTKDYSFKDQICRASVSVSNNIAEGFDRYNPKEFHRLLTYSIASCAEVKSMIYLAYRLEMINEKEKIKLYNDCVEVSKILKGLMKSLKTNNR